MTELNKLAGGNSYTCNYRQHTKLLHTIIL